MRKANVIRTKKNESGITLVALVVTIVVLLILAGITITMLFSDNGIITKAREAADAVDKAQGDTINGLEDLEGSMADVFVQSEVKKGEFVPVETKYKTYTDRYGSAPIPGGYCVVKDSTTDTSNKNTIASGLVISDLAGDTLDNEPNGSGVRGNQFVWVPVPDANVMYGTDSNGKKHGKLYEFSTDGKSNLNWTETDGIMSITSAIGNREPDVVTEYDGVDATNYADNFKEAISQTMIGANFRIQLENEFDDMIESVKKYKGFYIGRYETGNLSDNDKTVKPVVQKGATTANYANWYYQYEQIKNMSNDNATVSMIWGCQWDRTLEWIAQTNKGGYGLLTNSKTWGNYSGSEGDAAINSGASRPSGKNDAWQKNHIYDLAGNNYEWTMEASGTNTRIYHGGSYGGGTSVAERCEAGFPYSSPGEITSSVDSRCTLYVKK